MPCCHGGGDVELEDGTLISRWRGGLLHGAATPLAWWGFCTEGCTGNLGSIGFRLRV